MNIQLLGSGAYPLRFENGRSFSLFFPDYQLIIDGGFGLVGLPSKYRSNKLTILLTHYHHDHILGLAFLANFLEQGIAKKIDILGDERVEKLGSFFKEPFNPDYTPGQYPITMGYLPEESTIGKVRILRKQVPHSSGLSNMYRLEAEGKVAVVITDTTARDEYASFAKDADILFHECNYDNAHKDQAIAEGHSYTDVVASLAKAANVKQLVLIHTDPRYPDVTKEIEKAFPASKIGKDDQLFSI
jgi:ribonuclease BN (tRNA processing enzyme)